MSRVIYPVPLAPGATLEDGTLPGQVPTWDGSQYTAKVAPWSLAEPPRWASADDDEFDLCLNGSNPYASGNTVLNGWTTVQSGSVLSQWSDPTATPGVGVWNLDATVGTAANQLGSRRSRIRVQTHAGSTVTLKKNLSSALGTNAFLYARGSSTARLLSAVTQNDGFFSFGLMDVSNNVIMQVKLNYYEGSNNQYAQPEIWNGTTRKYGPQQSAASGESTAFKPYGAANYNEYVGLAKVANNWRLYWAPSNGYWGCLADADVLAQATAATQIFIQFFSAASTGPGCAVIDCDFIRRVVDSNGNDVKVIP